MSERERELRKEGVQNADVLVPHASFLCPPFSSGSLSFELKGEYDTVSERVFFCVGGFLGVRADRGFLPRRV